MTPYRQVITAPAAWTSRSIGGKAGLAHRLTHEQLAAFDLVLARSAHLAPQAVTRAEFDHPVIAALTGWIDRTIRHGRGAVILSGLTPEAYGEDGLERIYWGIGTHLGDAVVQSTHGDRLGHVRHVKDDPVARGYRSNQELMPHTDSHRVVGLMCLQRAETGGYSRIVSSLAIHNEILATRPDLLEPLYEGYHYALAEAQISDQPVTDIRIPVFACIDGQVSCCYSPEFIARAARLRNEPVPPRLAEALALMDAIAERDDMRVRFLMEPGECMLWHNFQMLHARDSYEDSAAHTRHLLRLWLPIQDDRPLPDAFEERARIYKRIQDAHRARAVAA